MQIKGKVCVVTGAASGIGAAVARAYAEAGARGVVVADLKTSRDRLAAVAGDIDGLAVTADVGLEDDIKALIAAAESKFGPVDVFFSNAGLSRKGQERPALEKNTSTGDRKSTRLNSSHQLISYPPFSLKKKKPTHHP